MILKTSLHIHCAEDPLEHGIAKYTIYQLIDRAQTLGFQVLTITAHESFVCRSEHIEYAKNKNILLIPGIEATLKINCHKKAHAVILNCDIASEKINTLDDLKKYRATHPEILVIAPHPDFGKLSLGLKILEQNQKLFDAFEHSWFYTNSINKNQATAILAKKLNKPLIATSDLHYIEYLNTDYALINASECTTEAVFTAIKNQNFTNYSEVKNNYTLFLFIFRSLLNLPQALFNKFRFGLKH